MSGRTCQNKGQMGLLCTVYEIEKLKLALETNVSEEFL